MILRRLKGTNPSAIMLCILAGVIVSLPVAAAAAPDGEPPMRLKDFNVPGLESKVTFSSIEPWDVVQLIEFLALRGGLNNIVIGKGVQGMTTKLKFEDVTVADALEVVLAVNRLAYEIKGGIVTIMTDLEYRELYGTSFYNQKQIRVVELAYADPVRVASMLDPIKSTIGTVVSDPVTGTLILIDTPEKIAEMRRIVEKTDISTISRVMNTVTRTFVLQYAELEDVQPEVASLLTKEAGSVRADRRTRTLIVTDLSHNMRDIEKLVASFDRRPKQVFVEAKLVQVSLTDDFRMGIDWNHIFHGIDPRFTISSVMSPTSIGSLADARTPVGSVSYGTIVGGGDLNVVIEALQEIGDTKILSTPNVTVLDGEEATIKVVTDQPYAQSKLESGTTNVVGEDIKFIEVGVSLSVTPRINDENLINMSIRPEVSSLVGTYPAFRPVPIVRKSYAETTVLIKDGQTVIIGGMIEQGKRERDSRVPFLGRIPLIGLLFRSESDILENNELIAFLSPRIVSGEEPFALSRDTPKATKPMRKVGSPVGSKSLKPLR